MNQSTVDLSQINLEEMIREMEEEEAVRVMNIIIENSKKILELQILINKEKKIKKGDRRIENRKEERIRRGGKRKSKEKERKKKKKKRREG